MNNQLEHSDQQLQEYEGFDQAEQQAIGTGNILNGDDDFPLVEDESSSKINSSAVIITLFILVSVGAVFGMRTVSNSNNTALGSNTEVENQIEVFLDSMASKDLRNSGGPDKLVNDTAILKVLSTSYADSQVKLEDVKKNPFRLSAFDSSPGQSQDTTAPEGASKRWKANRRELREKIEAASQSIIVNSLMSGSSPLASLNGKIVREGETITVGRDDVVFTVESINFDTVILVAESEEYDIKMQFTLGLKTN